MIRTFPPIPAARPYYGLRRPKRHLTRRQIVRARRFLIRANLVAGGFFLGLMIMLATALLGQLYLVRIDTRFCQLATPAVAAEYGCTITHSSMIP